MRRQIRYGLCCIYLGGEVNDAVVKVPAYVMISNRRQPKFWASQKQETMDRNLIHNFIQPDYRESVEEVLHDALAGKRQLTPG